MRFSFRSIASLLLAVASCHQSASAQVSNTSPPRSPLMSIPRVRTYDTFSGTNGTALASHVPDTGISWTKAAGYLGSAAIDANGRSRPNDNVNDSLYYSGATVAANSAVSAELTAVTDAGYQNIGFFDPGSGHGYIGGRGAGAWYVFKVNGAGDYTSLASGDTSPVTAGAKVRLELTYDPAQTVAIIKLWQDNALIYTVTQSSSPYVGLIRPCMFFGQGGGADNSTGLRWDNLICYDLPTPAYVECLGDSNTVGLGLGSPSTQAWPALLSGTYTPTNWTVVNSGNSGDTTYDFLAKAPTIIARFAARAEPLKIAVVMYGTNDIGRLDSLTGSASRLAAGCKLLQRAGIKVILLTIPPGALFIGATPFNQARDAFNNQMRTTYPWSANALSDFGADTCMADGAEQSTTGNFFQSDKVHLGTVGHQVLAQYAWAGIERVIAGGS